MEFCWRKIPLRDVFRTLTYQMLLKVEREIWLELKVEYYQASV